jgi:hypothetical protein
MRRISVTSSCLASVGYDPNQEKLGIAFLNGGVYEYRSVPASVYEQLMCADSKGAFFNEHIKEVFPCVVIRPPQ